MQQKKKKTVNNNKCDVKWLEKIAHIIFLMQWEQRMTETVYPISLNVFTIIHFTLVIILSCLVLFFIKSQSLWCWPNAHSDMNKMKKFNNIFFKIYSIYSRKNVFILVKMYFFRDLFIIRTLPHPLLLLLLLHFLHLHFRLLTLCHRRRRIQIVDETDPKVWWFFLEYR